MSTKAATTNSRQSQNPEAQRSNATSRTLELVVVPRPQTKVMAPRPTKLEDAASVTGEFKPAGSPVKPLYEQINDTNKAVRQLQTMAGLSADKQTLAAPTTAQLANSLKVATKSWKLIEKAVTPVSPLQQ